MMSKCRKPKFAKFPDVFASTALKIAPHFLSKGLQSLRCTIVQSEYKYFHFHDILVAGPDLDNGHGLNICKHPETTQFYS